MTKRAVEGEVAALFPPKCRWRPFGGKFAGILMLFPAVWCVLRRLLKALLCSMLVCIRRAYTSANTINHARLRKSLLKYAMCVNLM